MKKTTLTVLSHLILHDQMKVKGHIASIARLLTEPNDEVGGVVTTQLVFFTSLGLAKPGLVSKPVETATTWPESAK